MIQHSTQLTKSTASHKIITLVGIIHGRTNRIFRISISAGK